MAIQRAVVGAATNQDGNASTTTTKVINTLSQALKLKFKLAAAGDSSATNIVLKAGPSRNGSALALDGKITYSAVGGFSSYADMMTYYKVISTNIYGLIIQTTDTDNFEDNNLQISEQDPTGYKRTITIDLSEFRVSNGVNISDKITLTQTDLNQIVWAGMEITIDKIKPGSSMTFTFLVQGWNKVQELNAVQNLTLA